MGGRRRHLVQPTMLGIIIETIVILSGHVCLRRIVVIFLLDGGVASIPAWQDPES